MARQDYWLQIENHPWDVAPNGLDRHSGATFTRDANGMFKPISGDALIVRRYTANWAAPADQPLNAWDINELHPSLTQGSVPGATIEAKVGDDVFIHFRNNDQRAGLTPARRTHSLHAHGLHHGPLSDGTYPLSPPDPTQGNKQGDRVAPGSDFTYQYNVLHASTAGLWVYHDASPTAEASILQG